jgi:O-antigen ligase
MVVSHSAGAVALGLLWLVAAAAAVADGRLPAPGKTALAFLLMTAWFALSAILHGMPVGNVEKLFYYTPLLLIPYLRPPQEHLRRALVAVVLLCAGMVVLAVAQKAGGIKLPGPFQAYRGETLYGFSGHHIPLSGLYSISAIFALSLAFFGGLSRGTRGILLAAAAVLVGGVLLTKARTFYVALPLALALMTIHSRNRWMVLACALGGAAAAAYVISEPDLTRRFASIFDTTGDKSTLGRFAMWSVAVDVLREKWTNLAFGIGFGGWEAHALEYFARYRPDNMFVLAQAHVHNIFLHVLIEAGLLGLALYVVFVFSIVETLFGRVARHARPSFGYACSYGAMFSLLCYLVAGVFDFLHAPNLLLPFYTLMGFAMVRETPGGAIDR